MSDDISVGTNASLTVAEAAKADGGLILDAPGVNDDADERANRSLAAFAQGGDRDQQTGGERR